MGAAPETTLICGACGRRNRNGRKFCAECGAALAFACSACGAANEPDEAYCGECGSPLRAAAPAAPRTAVERRLVSVLFADLVGFTSLSEGRDPEEVRELLTRYFDLTRRVIEQHGGVVEKFIGDASMAVWGTPVAREDDAERAVRAALELVARVASLGEELGVDRLGARAGVLTGEAAVTLRAVGQGMVAGDLVNAASRVQALAEPGTVLVGEPTRRATEAAVAYEDAGVHVVKGKEEPLHLWRAVRVTAGRRGVLRSETNEPPFVGRARELRMLKEVFHASADERRAHLVSIVGVAGIGKSRLAWELQKYLDGLEQPVLWHSGRCPAYGEGVAFWALAEMLRMRAGIAEGEDAGVAREKLRAAIAKYVVDPAEREWLEPRLAPLLALEEDEGHEPRELFAGWRLFIERMAERAPVLLVFEDIQWADRALLEFVDYLLDWSRHHPVFVVALARPELGSRHSDWAAGRNSTTLVLDPLSLEAMGQLLDGFVPGLPEELRRRVLERAEGVPLYAVETVRMLLDRGLLKPHGSGYRPARPIEALDVPETLHALVAARLDGLESEERRVVQDAAVLGKTFTRDALEALVGGDVDAALTRLVRKEVLTLRSDPRSPERGQYAFVQDLVRQIAYETLSRRERKARHIATAEYLARTGEAADELAEIIASHYTAALALDEGAEDAATIRSRARTTLVKAGERAASLAATATAQTYFERALELAADSVERAELHERAGEMATLGLRTEEARSHLEQATAAFDELGLEREAARVTAQLGLLAWRQERDLDRGLETLERAFARLTVGARDPELASVAVQLGRLLFFRGRLDEAYARTELALEIAEALELAEILSHGWNTKALILDGRGRPREAELLMARALDVALAADVPSAALRAYVNACFIVGRVDPRRMLELGREGTALARRVGDRDSETAIGGWMVASLVELGEWDEAVEQERELMAVNEEAISEMIALYLARGDFDAAAARVAIVERKADAAEQQEIPRLAAVRAALALAEGRAADALASAQVGLSTRGLHGLTNHHVTACLAAALEAASALGDEEEVDELLGILANEPPGHLNGALRGIRARFAARRAAGSGDASSAETGFAEAERISRELGTPFRLAVGLLEHAEWLVASDRSDEARPLLAEAKQIFEQLEAAPWSKRAADLTTAAEPSVLTS